MPTFGDYFKAISAKKILIGLAVLCVLGATGYAGYFYWNAKTQGTLKNERAEARIEFQAHHYLAAIDHARRIIEIEPNDLTAAQIISDSNAELDKAQRRYRAGMNAGDNFLSEAKKVLSTNGFVAASTCISNGVVALEQARTNELRRDVRGDVELLREKLSNQSRVIREKEGLYTEAREKFAKAIGDAAAQIGKGRAAYLANNCSEASDNLNLADTNLKIADENKEFEPNDKLQPLEALSKQLDALWLPVSACVATDASKYRIAMHNAQTAFSKVDTDISDGRVTQADQDLDEARMALKEARLYKVTTELNEIEHQVAEYESNIKKLQGDLEASDVAFKEAEKAFDAASIAWDEYDYGLLDTHLRRATAKCNDARRPGKDTKTLRYKITFLQQKYRDYAEPMAQAKKDFDDKQYINALAYVKLALAMRPTDPDALTLKYAVHLANASNAWARAEYETVIKQTSLALQIIKRDPAATKLKADAEARTNALGSIKGTTHSNVATSPSSRRSHEQSTAGK
jgi:hypothetical protein